MASRASRFHASPAVPHHPVQLAAAVWHLPGRGTSPPRNLILISIDTLRADHLGIYGYERRTSPSLDGFARRSTLFRHAVSQGESTSPGHGAMLTGRYYSSYNRSRLPTGPPPWVDTLAEMLRREGFATWGFVDGGRMVRAFGFDQGFDHYEDRRIKIKALVEKANAWLDTHEAERFFLFVHCYDVHTPYNAPDPFGSMFVDPSYDGGFRPNAANFDAVTSGRLPFGREDLLYSIARYDGGIRHTDHHVGSFLTRLRETGLLDSSVVVITSDHGEEFLEHGGFQHRKIYFHENLHVPLIVHVPGRPPRVVDETVELIDIVPTTLDLLGLPPHPDVMGRSLVPLIDGSEATGGERIAFAESSLPRSGWRTVVTRRYQLLHDLRTGRQELYDLQADPRQQVDIAASRPDTVAELLQALRERLAENRRRNTGPPAARPVLDDGTRKQLRALGYVEE